MRLLLDTHAFLWWVSDDARLPRRARRSIEQGQCFVSVASSWEMAIKVSLRKLTLSDPVDRFVHEQLEANGFSLLTISLEHAGLVADLPFHHRDPFDRLLVAQALVDELAVVSGDEVFGAYGVKRVW